MELHAKTISLGIQKVFPEISESESLSFARVVGGVVAHTVRAVLGRSEEEANRMLNLCKRYVILPSVLQLVDDQKGL